MRRLRKFVFWMLGLGLFGALVGGAGLVYVLWHYGRDLPDYKALANYDPAMVTRVHAGDGELLAEYATENRVFVPLSAIPKEVIGAFLSAEDKTFYEHPGVDPMGILNAMIINLRHIGTDRRPVGASTITQQVAKNFLLTNQVSLERKVKEAILAFRIEQTYSKNRILELYLNEIYLGFGSYGVASAALNYFDKSLSELTLAEAAFLGALPKAPNNYNPMAHYEAALDRRNWVIGRMLEDGRITKAQADEARKEPLVVHRHRSTDTADGHYFSEDVRRQLVDLFGEHELYEGGLSVSTSLNPTMQEEADQALRQGLVDYDRRHGWRGALKHLDLSADGHWQALLKQQERPDGAGDWSLALVLEVGKEAATIGLPDGSQGRIPMSELKWARATLPDQRFGVTPSRPSDVLSAGDLVLVSPVEPGKEGEAASRDKKPAGVYGLRQIPNVNGALVALDPHTGRVLAMAGGFSYGRSEFNRATQAQRQTGSAFKPFVYLTAMDNGFTPASIVLDGPFVIDQGPGLGKWRPANYENDFLGPTPLRIGLEKSRNLMTIRLAQAIGMDKILDYAMRFGVFARRPEPVLSLALGAGETTLLRLTSAYAELVNGGKQIEPSLIDRVQSKTGETVWRHDKRQCPSCDEPFTGQRPPKLPDNRKQLVDPISAYQVVSMLQGVVDRGTGAGLRQVGITLGGKTGTTNEYQDAWFVGFSPDLAIGVYVGFDQPRTLGRHETGAHAALPIWRYFAKAVFKGKPDIPFRRPDGVSLVRIVHDTGRPAGPGDTRGVIWEAFKPGTEPSAQTAYEPLDPTPSTGPVGPENPYAPGAANPYAPGYANQGGAYQGQAGAASPYQQPPAGPYQGQQPYPTQEGQTAAQPGYPQPPAQPQNGATAGGLY
ncbi:penicillin-binding protein 1A [Tistlia consotensis]|uniref:Penicillin-binding protein 1A n=1 Tax=Tistlia consotensis USBA 355 TaxID=560819 RepID=A0A1Y6CJX1_9PROT|nr:penicillin-binding protein 1A [Tistlia consotensis]SMF67274.1 penicillin-binding protein 1A [Tistlia consotensis USBA 355]SNS00116.1 penicillin-binding protein 1A [Tistlia consotensis]